MKKSIKPVVAQPRKKKASPKPTTKKKKPWIAFVFLAIGIIVSLGVMGKYFAEKYFFYNPLLGTWRAQTALGMREIVFERESMTSFGSKTRVHYDVKKDEVVVMDTALQLGNSYKIIDKDTISSKMGNVTTLYKRVP